MKLIIIGKATKKPDSPTELVDVLRFRISDEHNEHDAVKAAHVAWHRAYGDGGTTYGPWRLYHFWKG